MKALVSSDKLPAPAGPYSPGVTVGEWIFLSGQGGFDPNTGKVVSDDLVEQTEQTFNNIETVLEAAGASLDDVISCLVQSRCGRRCARTSLPASSSRSLWSLERLVSDPGAQRRPARRRPATDS